MIAEAAAKQCGRNRVTKINQLYNLKNINQIIEQNDVTIVAYEDEKSTSLKDVLNEFKFKHLQQELSFAALNNFDESVSMPKKDDDIKIAVIIGPEGGLEQKEVEFFKSIGVKSVSLGKRILRTETVAMAITSIIMYELGDFGEITE